MKGNRKDLNDKWEKRALYEIASILMGQSPPSNTYNTEGNGLPFYQGNKDFGFKYPNKKVWCSNPVRIAEKGSVLISVRAPVGDVNMTLEKCCIGRGVASINSDNNEFIYYLMKFNKEKFKNIFENEGTVFGCLTKEGLRNFNVIIPKDKKVKNKIAKILSSLDDKIELNNKMNRTLEKIAQAMFKHWFIDFEFPNENSKPYKSSGGKMVDSELGKIPEGWKVVNAKSILNIVYGEGLSKKFLKNTGYPVYGGNGIIGYFDRYMYKDRQVIISCRGAASGKILTTKPYSFVTSNSLVFEIRDKKNITFDFLKCYCEYIDFSKYVTGTAQPQITIENLNEFKMILPAKEILDLFTVQIGFINEKHLNNEYQNQTLSQLRDSLLPRLMTGKISIGGAK